MYQCYEDYERQVTAKKLRKEENLGNELFEFCDRLIQVCSNADWRCDVLTLQIHNMNLHHHLFKGQAHNKIIIKPLFYLFFHLNKWCAIDELLTGAGH